MSHLVAVPDELFSRLSALAHEHGQPIEHVIADLLARELETPATRSEAASPGLDWQTASAEEIIAARRSSRVERERPIEL